MFVKEVQDIFLFTSCKEKLKRKKESASTCTWLKKESKKKTSIQNTNKAGAGMSLDEPSCYEG